jgi:hypothetical protein
MPSLPVERRRCSFLRSSPYQTDDPGRPVDLLDGKAKRERSDRPGESSLSCRQPTPNNSCQRSGGRQRGRRPSASPKRSDRVPPSTRRRPSPRSERMRAVGEAGGPLRKIKNKEGKRDIDPGDLSLCDRAGRHLSTFGSWWFMPGTPVTLSCSPRCIAGSVHR